MSRVQWTLKTVEEEYKEEVRESGERAEPSVSASRSLLLPEASDFENTPTLFDTIFSNYTEIL